MTDPQTSPLSPFDRMPMPPAAKLLGWRLLDHDAAVGRVRIGFDGRPDFTNPAGFVQGGFLAAMLDDTMGPAVFLASGGRLYTATIDLSVHFLGPARPGMFAAEGRVVRLGQRIAFMEAALADATGAEVARATASARLVAVEKLSVMPAPLPTGPVHAQI